MSKQRLIDASKIEYTNTGYAERWRIDIMPTIEPPVLRGEWIDNGDYITTAYGHLNVYNCSNCKEDITIDNHDRFCPNCGAKMKEVD